jgi:type I restriction enzyme S subunit
MTPEGWKRRRLGEFCTEQNRKAGATVLPVLSVSKDRGIILQSDKFKKRIASDDTSRYKRIRRGEFAYDPMLLWSGSIARQRCVEEGVISPAYYAFSVDASIDAEFLEYFLKRREMTEVYSNISFGTNARRRKATFSDFTALEFAFPPVEEQRKIALILRSADKGIQATQAVIDQTRKVKRGLMQDLLARGIGHTRFKRTKIGQLPESWDVRTLRACLRNNAQNGLYKPADQIGTGTLLIGQTSIANNRVLNVELARRADVNEEELQSFGLAAGDILITRVFATLAGVGRPAMVPPLPEPAVYESNMMRLQVDTSTVMPKLLFEILLSPSIRAVVHSVASLSNQASINQAALHSLLIPVPPMEEQEKITNAFSAADEVVNVTERQLSALVRLQTGMMQDLLTGRVRVPTS